MGGKGGCPMARAAGLCVAGVAGGGLWREGCEGRVVKGGEGCEGRVVQGGLWREGCEGSAR
eukprot:scaffold6270_cov98-Isochrysis_galbana.AAC.1